MKKGNGKECSNYCTIALISHASKVMLKILQARLQYYDGLKVKLLVRISQPRVSKLYSSCVDKLAELTLRRKLDVLV